MEPTSEDVDARDPDQVGATPAESAPPGEDTQTDTTQASAEEVDRAEASALRRQHLAEEMPQEAFDQVVAVTFDLIERRFQTMRKIVDVTKNVNINPFLMLAMAPAYNIYSPFEAAEYLQYQKLPHGDATSFGRFVEEKIFPIFGCGSPPEKAQNPTLWSPIDADLTVEGVRYLASWKSGPWTINQSGAHEMNEKFPQIHEDSGLDIILGIFYGKYEQLNNKPGMVQRGTGDYFHVMVGKDLWEFVTGVKDAHLTILQAIREAQSKFALAHGGKTFYEHTIESRLKLAQSFRETFNLLGSDDDMWEMLFKEAF